MLDDMKSGKLSAEPELEIVKKEKSARKSPAKDDAQPEEEEEEVQSEPEEPDDFFE